MWDHYLSISQAGFASGRVEDFQLSPEKARAFGRHSGLIAHGARLSCRDGKGVVSSVSDRPRRTAIWILIGLSLLGSLGFLLGRVVDPSDGATIPFYADAWKSNGVLITGSAGPGDGLASGDVVVAVAGQPLTAWLDGVMDPSLDRPGTAPGAEIQYQVRRGAATLDVPVRLLPTDMRQTLNENWSVLLFTIVLQIIAAYVLWRRPDASGATALAVASVGVTGSTLPWLLGLDVIDIVRGSPFLLYVLTAGGLYMLLWPAGALHLPLAMANPERGPSRRVLAVSYGAPLGGYVIGLLAARIASPSSVAWVGTWAAVQGLVIIPTMLVGIFVTIRSFRASAPAVREQIRWAALGGGLATVSSLVLLLVPQLLTGRPIIPWSAVGLLALPLPLGIAAGILRYRLFDIDVVVNRTLVYGGATVAIGAIYAVSVAIAGTFLRFEGGFVASLLATGMAAIVALPIRDALQRTVNRVMYGDRDDPYRALSRLGRRLEQTLDPFEAPSVIVRTVAESLHLPWVGLRIGPAGETGRTIAHGGEPPGLVTSVPLTYGAEVVGDLMVSGRTATDPLSAADWKLLEALAPQAGAAVHSLRLSLDLIESREHLVAAREEERRRIRRDLHDGLGPTLAAIGMRAEVAADLVAADPAGAASVLGELRGEVHGALGDIRRLVDALRPPALDELGLVGAIQAQAGLFGPEPTIDVASSGPLPELPAAVEVAAYRITMEAMTNAARHAHAQTCGVRISITEEAGRALEVEVTDDGGGLPTRIRPGIGLLSMRERAAEVGGTCVVESGAEGGTRVLARLPLDSAAASLGSP